MERFVHCAPLAGGSFECSLSLQEKVQHFDKSGTMKSAAVSSGARGWAASPSRARASLAQQPGRVEILEP